MPLRPAAFADPVALCAAWTAGRRFGVCGFPRRRDAGERHASVTTDPSWSREREWWEIRTGPGDVLEEGYSGSAVYDTVSGEVIGMVTNAELRGGADRGWMLPITRIRRYWEELDDLLPLPWLTASARRELREALAGVPCGEALRAGLAEVAGRPPVEAFRSAWDAVRFVAEGWPEVSMIREGGDRAAPHLSLAVTDGRPPSPLASELYGLGEPLLLLCSCRGELARPFAHLLAEPMPPGRGLLVRQRQGELVRLQVADSSPRP